MNMTKRSVIFKTSAENLQQIINESSSYVEVIAKLGLNPHTGNHRTLKKRLATEHFDLSEFKKRQKEKRRLFLSSINFARRADSNHIFCENSKYTSRQEIKKKLLQEKGFKYECVICKNTGEYNKLPLSLQLDHINGINDDNRVENLRFLCPNCHSQTSTFSGKRFKKRKSRCYSVVDGKRKYFSKIDRSNTRKVKWPSKEHLEKLVWLKPTMQIAKEFNVSDVAVAKWCKLYEIPKPPRGYWSKQKANLWAAGVEERRP